MRRASRLDGVRPLSRAFDACPRYVASSSSQNYQSLRSTSFICAGWCKAGLFRFNPEKVLRGSAQPLTPSDQVHAETTAVIGADFPRALVKTPTSANGLTTVRAQLDRIVGAIDDEVFKTHVQKVVNGAKQSFANCALLVDENRRLVAQNSEKEIRKSTKVTVVGPAKTMSYEDMVQARKRRGERQARVAAQVSRKLKHPAKEPVRSHSKPSCQVKAEATEREIAAAGLLQCCTVLRFN